jgi:hypothetical protein
MDDHLAAAARALSVFDPLEALRYVSVRRDARALALRGVAHAQLGEFGSARKLLSRAARALSAEDPAASARCIAAEAEVALACRDLAAAGRGFASARAALERLGDTDNASFVRLQEARRMILLGDLRGAERVLGTFGGRRLPARTVAVAELIGAELALRRPSPREAHAALDRARTAARFAKLPALISEVDRIAKELAAPVARLAGHEGEQNVTLDDVEEILESGALVVDGCRREVRQGARVASLVTRPVLFALATELGRGAPGEVTRIALIERVFGGRANESHRARLRVEVGRLRRLLSSMAEIRSTPLGYALSPKHRSRVSVLSPPLPGDAGVLLSVLAGGESWSTSALSDAAGMSQRAVQRVLGQLSAEGRVYGVGRGRAQRWVAKPLAGFATTLLLAARPLAE